MKAGDEQTVVEAADGTVIVVAPAARADETPDAESVDDDTVMDEWLMDEAGYGYGV